MLFAFFFMFSDFTWKKKIAPGNGGGRHMILFDLPQVFDMKDLEGSWNPSRSKLVKMKCIDVSETVIEWFKPYLLILLASFDKDLSDATTIECDVLQGSV